MKSLKVKFLTKVQAFGSINLKFVKTTKADYYEYEKNFLERYLQY